MIVRLDTLWVVDAGSWTQAAGISAGLWRQACAAGLAYTRVPEQRSVCQDVGLVLGAELYALPLLERTGTVLQVERPLQARFTPADWRRP